MGSAHGEGGGRRGRGRQRQWGGEVEEGEGGRSSGVGRTGRKGIRKQGGVRPAVALKRIREQGGVRGPRGDDVSLPALALRAV